MEESNKLSLRVKGSSLAQSDLALDLQHSKLSAVTKGPMNVRCGSFQEFLFTGSVAWLLMWCFILLAFVYNE